MTTPHNNHEPDLTEFRSVLLDEPDLAAARTRVRAQLEQAYEDESRNTLGRRFSPTLIRRVVYGTAAAAAAIALIGTTIVLTGDNKVNIQQVDQPTPTTSPSPLPSESSSHSNDGQQDKDRQGEGATSTATPSPSQSTASQPLGTAKPMPVYASKYVIGKKYPIIPQPGQGTGDKWTMKAGKPVTIDLAAQGGLPKNASKAYILVELMEATQDGSFKFVVDDTESWQSIQMSDPETGNRNSRSWVVETTSNNNASTFTSSIDATYKLSLIGYQQGNKSVSDVDLSALTTGSFRIFAKDKSAACLVEANRAVSCVSNKQPQLPTNLKGLRVPEDSYCDQDSLNLELRAGRDPSPWCPGDLFVGEETQFDITSPGAFTAPGGITCRFNEGTVSCRRAGTGQAFTSGPDGWSVTSSDGSVIELSPNAH